MLNRLVEFFVKEERKLMPFGSSSLALATRFDALPFLDMTLMSSKFADLLRRVFDGKQEETLMHGSSAVAFESKESQFPASLFSHLVSFVNGVQGKR